MTGKYRLARPNYSICAKVQKNITRPTLYRVDNIYYVINRDYDSTFCVIRQFSVLLFFKFEQDDI